jgi:hypothetical protein
MSHCLGNGLPILNVAPTHGSPSLYIQPSEEGAQRVDVDWVTAPVVVAL